MSANKGSPKPQRIPDDLDPNHWETVSINYVTLATLALVGLFTLVGLSEEVLASPRLRGRFLVTGLLAIAAYLLCLWFAYRAIFSESIDTGFGSSN